METPRLLMLSGIGPPNELRRLGITVRVALPGVGQNLHDHLSVPVVLAAARDIAPGNAVPPMHSYWSGTDEIGGVGSGGIFFHIPLPSPGLDIPPSAFTFLAELNQVESRGTLTLTSSEPDAPLLLDPHYLDEQADVDRLVDALVLTREIALAPALRPWCRGELFPGAAVTARSQLRAYARAQFSVPHHQVGTCRMGVDEAAVVDPQLRVRGIEGLRIADASVMPVVTTGNTHAPSVLIGGMAAELVRAAHGLPVR